MFDADSARNAIIIQMLSWFQRQILHAGEPPGVEESLKVLEGLGFTREELETAHWRLVISHANRMAAKHGLRAAYLEGAGSVGVMGDARSYTPVIVLYGPFPGWEILRELGTNIPNHLPVNRVTYEFAIKGTPLSELMDAEQLKQYFSKEP